jgi:hypothetical protein
VFNLNGTEFLLASYKAERRPEMALIVWEILNFYQSNNLF